MYVSLVQWLCYARNYSALRAWDIQEYQLALHRLGPTAHRHVGDWGERLGDRFGVLVAAGGVCACSGDTGLVGGRKRCGGWRVGVADLAAAAGGV